MSGEQSTPDQEDEFTDVCVVNNIGELMSLVWRSLVLIFRDASFIDLFWAWIPYIVGVVMLLYVLSNVQWIGKSQSQSKSSERIRRSGSKSRY